MQIRYYTCIYALLYIMILKNKKVKNSESISH